MTRKTKRVNMAAVTVHAKSALMGRKDATMASTDPMQTYVSMGYGSDRIALTNAMVMFARAKTSAAASMGHENAWMVEPVVVQAIPMFATTENG